MTAAAPVKATSVVDDLDDTVREHSAWYVDGTAAPHVLRLPVVAGSFADRTESAVAVSASLADDHGWQVDEEITLWMGDGATARLRVAAVVEDRLGLPAVFLPWHLARAHATTPTPDTVHLTLAPDADLPALGAALTDTESHLATLDERFDRLSRLSLLAMLGVALLYTAIAIANTQLIAPATGPESPGPYASSARRDARSRPWCGARVSRWPPPERFSAGRSRPAPSSPSTSPSARSPNRSTRASRG